MVQPRSCRVIYYFDTPTLGRRYQSFGHANYRFLHDRVVKKEIQIRFISSKNQLTDVLTKPLSHSTFALLRS